MDERLKDSVEEHREALEALAEYGQTELAEGARMLLERLTNDDERD